MSCVRESSPQSEHVVSQRSEPKRRRFHPLRGLRRIFKRKAPSTEPNEVKSFDTIIEPSDVDTSKSRSTSQLIDEPFTRRRSLHSTLLSVSHDSVFNPEQHSGQSDSESAVSVPRLGFPQANIQAELLEAVRRRRKVQNDDDSDVDEDDLGLPRSPSMHSPTIATGNDLILSKELITKSSHSTCSDGSLLSMGSSEMDEDSLGAHNSRHSSKISLHDKRTYQTHLDSSDGDSSTSVPLSHSAAKHRMAIRPKRKPNPRSKKPLTVTSALPATPEVNEEHSGRSTSPETKPQTSDTADGTTTTTTTVTITNTSTTSSTTITTTTSATIATVTISTNTDATVELCDLDTSIDEISVENVPRREESFFHRLLSRRSTKKKTATKSHSAEDVDVDRFLFDESIGAKPRQREEPPPASRMQLSYPPDLPPDQHYQPLNQHSIMVTTPVAENMFASDTFVPIKESFSIGQSLSNVTDDDATSSGGGSSSPVQISLSSDSVSSAALDESIVMDIEPGTAERCRSYSSSESECHHNNGSSQHQRPLPVPAPRLSKLYNGISCSGNTTDVVMRRKKSEDQQPELLKVFARRSLKLEKDGEPEFILLADEGVGGGSKDYSNDKDENIICGEQIAENNIVLVTVEEKPKVDVNENQTEAEVMPKFKRIQQRREEWEKRLLQQQRN